MGALRDIFEIRAGMRKQKQGKGTGSSSSSPGAPHSELPDYDRGGKVRKTGPARLKKGEMVLTRSQQRRRLKRRY